MAHLLTRRRLLWGWLGGGSSLLLVACRRNSVDNSQQVPHGSRVQPLELTSPAFEAEAFIPAQFTCNGANQSPPLTWTDPPPNTQSWTLVLQSESGKIGWAIYDLPVSLRSLPAAVPPRPFLTAGGVQAKLESGQYGYQGPCSDGSYVFRLYAVKRLLDLPPGVPSAEVEAALKSDVVAETTLKVRYRRSS
ncbi:MAG: YbhB/YbcL family Raf kinase inhibitor-like protein [Elainella sp.]